MNRNPLVLAALLSLFAVSARAQLVEQALAAVKTQAQAALKNDAVFPKLIVCGGPSVKAAGLDGEQRFYTRLETLKASDVPASGSRSVWDGRHPLTDETAAGLNDYRGASIDAKAFRYTAMSCDTQDYEFTFPTAQLRRKGLEDSRPVTGHLLSSTRGRTDFDGDLECTAFYR